MKAEDYIIEQVPNLYTIIALKDFRHTPNVTFDVMPTKLIPRVDGLDRVIHNGPAVSPGPVGEVERPWYMHTAQWDNLFVLYGVRNVELYTPEHGKVEKFVVTPDYIEHNGKRVVEGGSILIWPTRVFHRVVSGPEGSRSINLATRDENLDMRHNFDIYDLNVETGEYHVIREGYKDQKMDDATK